MNGSLKRILRSRPRTHSPDARLTVGDKERNRKKKAGAGLGAAPALSREIVNEDPVGSGSRHHFFTFRADRLVLRILHAVHAERFAARVACHRVIRAEEFAAERAFCGIVKQHLGLTNPAFYAHASNPEDRPLVRAGPVLSVLSSGIFQKNPVSLRSLVPIYHV